MSTRLSTCATTAAIAVFALSACGSSPDSPGSGGPYGEVPPTSATPSRSSGASGGADLGVADSPLGRIVVDGKKMTAYYFTKDTPGSGKSACAGPCLQAWPPITAFSDTPLVEGVSGKVGTITLPDGSRQITVGGRPLYLFTKDTKPGDVLGQGVNKAWYVLGPDGTMITAEP